jgi:NitT/TauT family transport system substrate-binding protein
MLGRFYVTIVQSRRTATNLMAVLIVFSLCAIACEHAAAESIKIGAVKVVGGGPLYIAQERGYFAAEGIPAELVFFDSAQPVAVATVAGSIDFGVAPPTGGFYSLAGQGALRIIAAGIREAPGFHYFAYLASGRAYEAGLKSVQQLVGHAVATTQIGSPGHYSLGLLAGKYRFDLKASGCCRCSLYPMRCPR